MKCKALFFTLLLLPFTVSAQNLVPNGSFEDYVSCPEHLDGLEFAEHWYKSIIEPGVDYYQNPSPDYFHGCAQDTIFGVPNNIAGTQMALTGDAYCGMINYSSSNSNYREILGVELISPLVVGQTYYCSLHISRAAGWSGSTGLAINNIGMKFSNSQIFSSTELAVDDFAHMKGEEVAIDSVNWVLLYGEIIPEESYQYLHIGNFYSDEDTEVMTFSQSSVWAYYYIDDVRVSTDPLVVSSAELRELGRDINVFPNPVKDELNIISPRKLKNIQIYSISGQMIVDVKINSEEKTVLGLGHISKGLYIGVVEFENGDTESIKINKI